MPTRCRRRQPDFVVHERARHVAMEVLTRLQPDPGQVVRLGLPVQLGEEAGDPEEAGLDEDDLEAREALEGAGEDPPGDDLSEREGRQRGEDRRCGVGSRRNTSQSEGRLPRWWLIEIPVSWSTPQSGS